MSVILRSILLIILAGLLVCGAEAYIITIAAPDSVIKGTSLVITGQTTFPEHSYFDIVLFYSKYTSGELKRQRVIVDDSKEFRVEFETRELERGQYKIEVHSIKSNGKEFMETNLGSSSVVRKIVQLIDRTNEVVFDSPFNQTISDALNLVGRVKNAEGAVITLRIFGPDAYTYGPEQLITTTGYADSDGHFTHHVPLENSGEYQVSLSDNEGFIGEYTFNISDDSAKTEPTLTPTPAKTPQITSPPSPPSTPQLPSQTQTPSKTRSPLPTLLIIWGITGGLYLIQRERKE